MTPLTVACQASLSVEFFSTQEYQSGLPCLLGYLPDPGIKPTSLKFPALLAGSLPLEPPGKPYPSIKEGTINRQLKTLLHIPTFIYYVVHVSVSWTEEPGGLQFMGLQRVSHNLETKQQQQGSILIVIIFCLPYGVITVAIHLVLNLDKIG